MKRFLQILLLVVLGSLSLQAQEKGSISGEITNQSGVAVIGANAFLKGTNFGQSVMATENLFSAIFLWVLTRLTLVS